MSQVVRMYFLEGKDYLDQWEAAHFMSMSLSKFKLIIRERGVKIKPFNSFGKTVYRKSELIKEMEKQAKKKA